MKIFILIIIVLLSTPGYSQTPTLIGVHGTTNPTVANQLKAQIVRTSYNDFQIKNAILNGLTQAIDDARALDSLNIKEVIALTWPITANDHAQRIPTGIDSVEVFHYLDIFINEIGPYIDYIQISQEPLGLTSYN